MKLFEIIDSWKFHDENDFAMHGYRVKKEHGDTVLAGILQSAAEKSFKLKEPNLKKMWSLKL